ncbi:hypothetical protein DPEC_G00218240 [Dallia pectoralis]|uniref:Uncharacterized protein n=1 Tax=Dallia pectoralis TaxID=75939 RepID=A0ACC2G362_DALPE|nr:hypothetical protein DPEC_G00218240 [Dallia pectoralis]
MDIIDPILGIAKHLYDRCTEVKANKKRCQRMASRIKALEEVLRSLKVNGLGKDPARLENGLRELKLTLESAQDVVEKYASASYLKRILKAYDQGDDFECLNERLNDAAQVLSLALQVEQREKLQQVFTESMRAKEDEADRESDCLELHKLLKSLAEGTKECLDSVHEKVESTQKDVKDIKAMLETLQKPSILIQDIREIKPEELTYDVPKEVMFKNDFSELYKGEYNKFTVAIKRYTQPMSTNLSQVRETFRKEVETMRRFESPNILRMFGICVQDENRYYPDYLIVMEFCEKGSLREVLDSQSKLPWERKAHMSLDAAQGIYRLHQSEEKFKVHGCINSSKFLVAAGYRVKLGGFELAKTETSLKKTKSTKRSSLSYCSPQQLESINYKYNKACEMYSFGIVLWEIATRKIPFKDLPNNEVYQRVCKDRYKEPLPEDCPKTFEELIDACRSYDGFSRPTAGVLVDKLRKVVDQTFQGNMEVLESMEVDLQLGGPSREPDPDSLVEVPIVIGSGSETEVEDEAETVARDPPRLPTTWAFSQNRVRVEGQVGPRVRMEGPVGTRVTTGAAQRQRRTRSGIRVHHATQPSAPASRFLDFLLRAPAANQAEPDSGSTTEVSESEDEPEAPGPAAVSSSPRLNPPVAMLTAQRLNPAEATITEAGNQVNPEVVPASVPSGSVRTPPPPQVDETEGENCPVCFEPWTTSGEHRLAALRCGHLFGHNCIERWVRSQGQAAKCPQCNKKAKRSDIVLLYARKLKAVDNTDQERVKRSLEQEQSLRRKAELESAQCRLQLQVITDECGKLRKQVQELRTLMAQPGCGASQSKGTSFSGLSQRHDNIKGGQYVFSKAVLVSQAGGCRVLSYCEPLSCLLASQPSPHNTLVPGCGVKKVSTVNMKACQYVPIHGKQIRGLSFSRQADGLLLSAALDSTIKLTSLMTNTVVQTYNTGKPVWSCCWCLDNNSYVYAGLSNGSVLVYDTRDTSTHVQELVPLRSRCPVASLTYVPRAASSSFPCGGLIAGSLEGGCFWEQVEGTTYRPHVLPLETGGCTDIQVEPESRHCLVTYRPGRSNPSLRCVLMELNRTPQMLTAQEPACSCNPVQIFSAGSSCKLLTKNAVFRSPAGEGSTLVCAGDESTNSTMVWDAKSGSLIQKLPADLPVLDICPFEVNQENYLASLTEKMLKIYKWE